MACVYQEAEMMIYPSIFEGFGIPILEALNSRIPVITSKDGCFKEAGGESSLYVDPLSIDEISHAITKIDNDSILRKEIVEKGYQHAQNFNDDIIAKNLANLYNSL